MTTNATAGNGETTYGPEWLEKGRLEAIIRRLKEDPRYFISNRLAKVLVPAILNALHGDGGKVEAVLHNPTEGKPKRGEWVTDAELEKLARLLRDNPKAPLAHDLAEQLVFQLGWAQQANREVCARNKSLTAEQEQLSAAARRLESSLRKGDDLVSRQSAHIKAQDEIIRRMGRENEALNAQLEAAPAAEVWADDDAAGLPAAEYAGDCPPEPPSAFRLACEELCDLHDRKNKDYGTAGDPFANIRGSEAFGIPAWLGAILRGNDKVKRIQAFAQKGALANEPLEDSLMDLAVYAIIGLVLYRESVTSHAGSGKAKAGEA